MCEGRKKLSKKGGGKSREDRGKRPTGRAKKKGGPLLYREKKLFRGRMRGRRKKKSIREKCVPKA